MLMMISFQSTSTSSAVDLAYEYIQSCTLSGMSLLSGIA